MTQNPINLIIFKILILNLLSVSSYSQFKIGPSLNFDNYVGYNYEEVTMGNKEKSPIILFGVSMNLNTHYKLKKHPLDLQTKIGAGVYPIEYIGTLLLAAILPGFFEPSISPYFNYELGANYLMGKNRSIYFAKSGIINKSETFIFENNHIHGVRIIYKGKPILFEKINISVGLNSGFIKINSPYYDSNSGNIIKNIQNRLLIGPSIEIAYNF